MPISQPPFAVLWDLDGTLIDSENYWMQAERQLASRYSGQWESHDGLQLIGLSLFESSVIMKDRMQIDDLSPLEIIDELTDSVMANLAKEVPWRPGAKELLLQLRGAGIKTALVTMSMKRMAQVVVDAIDFDAFDLVLGGDEVENGKPHPDPYLKAAAALSVSPEHCIAIEDSLNGLLSAEAAGTKAIGVPNIVNLPAQPNRIIWQTLEGATLSQLQELFN